VTGISNQRADEQSTGVSHSVTSDRLTCTQTHGTWRSYAGGLGTFCRGAFARSSPPDSADTANFFSRRTSAFGAFCKTSLNRCSRRFSALVSSSSFSRALTLLSSSVIRASLLFSSAKREETKINCVDDVYNCKTVSKQSINSPRRRTLALPLTAALPMLL
jgi:hypothetical protein